MGHWEASSKTLSCNSCWKPITPQHSSSFKTCANPQSRPPLALECTAGKCHPSAPLLLRAPPRSICQHLYCPPCAERHFSVKLACPICSRGLTPDDIVELVHGEDMTDAMQATFTLACVRIEDAMRLVQEAAVFCREQTALIGERRARATMCASSTATADCEHALPTTA